MSEKPNFLTKLHLRQCARGRHRYGESNSIGQTITDTPWDRYGNRYGKLHMEAFCKWCGHRSGWMQTAVFS